MIEYCPQMVSLVTLKWETTDPTKFSNFSDDRILSRSLSIHTQPFKFRFLQKKTPRPARPPFRCELPVRFFAKHSDLGVSYLVALPQNHLVIAFI